ncbi:hypothetical protein SAMN05444365_101653 [Micromonospora pattaloongensis]|uniref:Uncharacterized protein n=1 Tax=Micromonospora pattaloongensis TaxID=405436 RepID=A0A1H3H411_9ACTN|nr:hypothetical protein [Micromonospora pattaloongensis]SDY09658.1 hypothetical protein SAMN05444365_101653 [Micromonospora pattaloongensis]
MSTWLHRTVGTLGVAGGFLMLAGGPAQAQDAQPLPTPDPQELPSALELPGPDPAADAPAGDPPTLPAAEITEAPDGAPIDAVPLPLAESARVAGAAAISGTALDRLAPLPTDQLPALIGDALTAQHPQLFQTH